MVSEFRSAPFSVSRWSIFTRALNAIHNAFNELQTNPQFNYVYNIDGGVHFSAAAGYQMSYDNFSYNYAMESVKAFSIRSVTIMLLRFYYASLRSGKVYTLYVPPKY